MATKLPHVHITHLNSLFLVLLIPLLKPVLGIKTLYPSSMSNPMSSNRDEGRSFKNVEHFGPSLSEVIETADLSNDTPADVFRNSRSRLNDVSRGKFVTLEKCVDKIHPPSLAKNLL